MWVSELRSLRWVYALLLIANAIVVILGVFVAFLAYPPCTHRRVVPYMVVTLASAAKVIAIIRVGIAQQDAAVMILASEESTIVDTVIRQKRRVFDFFCSLFHFESVGFPGQSREEKKQHFEYYVYFIVFFYVEFLFFLLVEFKSIHFSYLPLFC